MDRLEEFKLKYPKAFIRKEPRFDKTKSVEQGYMEIYANNMFTRVNINHNINSMKQLHGFCACNELPAGRFAKLQGGYYILDENNQWKFIGTSLNSIPFSVIYNELSKLKVQ